MARPRQYQYRQLCLGIDQAYSRTGIAIAGKTNDGDIEIIHAEAVPGLVGKGMHQEYRRIIKDKIRRIMRKYRALGDECFALCESVRVHTEGAISIKNHLAWGALQGSMSDYLMERHQITLRVVDTRAWKAAVVGTSKPALDSPIGIDPKKWPTIQCVLYEWDVPKELLTRVLSPKSKKPTWQNKTGDKFTYDDNIADACCIALYGLIKPTGGLKLAP